MRREIVGGHGMSFEGRSFAGAGDKSLFIDNHDESGDYGRG
jgi:hypothetical protein